MNKRVLITGSSRGIGKAIALQLAEAGFDIALHFHSNKVAAEQTREELSSLGLRSLFCSLISPIVRELKLPSTVISPSMVLTMA